MKFLYFMWIFLGVSAIVLLIIIICYGWTKAIGAIKQNAELIKICIAVLAAFYTGAVYHMQVVDKRVSTSLEYRKKLDEGPIREAFMTLNQYWISDQTLKDLIGYRKIEKEYIKTKEKYKNKIVQEAQYDKQYKIWENANKSISENASSFAKKNKLQKHILTQYEFFYDVVICVKQDRCDRETACQLFANEIENFRLNYSPIIEELEAAWQGNQSMFLQAFQSDCEKSGYLEVVSKAH